MFWEIASVFSSLVAGLSLAGNTLVLVILVRFENLKSLTNSFLLNLAVSDVIFSLGLACVPLLMLAGVVNAELLWKIALLLLHTGFYSNTLLLIMMTVHCYLVVLHPLSDVQSQTGSYSIAASVVTWIVSFSASIPELQGLYRPLSFRQSIFFFLLLGVAVICNIGIFQKQSKTPGDRRDRTARAVFRIVTVYTLLWTPFSILKILVNSQFSYNAGYLDIVLFISHIIAATNCCIKPIMYIVMGDTFRSRVMKCQKHSALSNNKETSFL